MLSGLYIKLIASAIILAIVGGGYAYVRHLATQNTQLKVENSNLQNSVKELKATVEDVTKQQEDLNKVVAAGDAIKEENKRVHRQQLQNIDNGVRQGKDRPVGPLLKEFLNG